MNSSDGVDNNLKADDPISTVNVFVKQLFPSLVPTIVISVLPSFFAYILNDVELISLKVRYSELYLISRI